VKKRELGRLQRILKWSKTDRKTAGTPCMPCRCCYQLQAIGPFSGPTLQAREGRLDLGQAAPASLHGHLFGLDQQRRIGVGWASRRTHSPLAGGKMLEGVVPRPSTMAAHDRAALSRLAFERVSIQRPPSPSSMWAAPIIACPVHRWRAKKAAGIEGRAGRIRKGRSWMSSKAQNQGRQAATVAHHGIAVGDWPTQGSFLQGAGLPFLPRF